MASVSMTAIKNGHYHRPAAQFRNCISNEPDAEFPAEADRYHLYISYACPWAHRTLIVRQLKGLERLIPFTAVTWEMFERGWVFADASNPNYEPKANVTPDPHHSNATHVRDVYLSVNPNYEGRFSVPVLYDKKADKIVSNESSEIIRMFYHSFDHLLPERYRNIDLLPKELDPRIDEVNGWVYDHINNGVYKTGFATTQDAYETYVTNLFSALDRVEAHLSTSATPFYFGDKITEADVRLFPTIVRFDPVYVQHFKCNIKDIRSGFPAIHRWLRSLYWNHEAFHNTTRFDHIKKHYTRCHERINPLHITSAGPVPDILEKDEEVAAVSGSKQ